MGEFEFELGAVDVREFEFELGARLELRLPPRIRWNEVCFLRCCTLLRKLRFQSSRRTY